MVLNLIVAALFSAVIMIFLLASPTRSETEKDRMQGFSHPDQPIQIKAGREFSIKLQSNPTTGYKWRLTRPPDGKVLLLVRSEYERPENAALAGSGGIEIWTFRALSPGKTSVTFQYIRPWEKVPPSKILTFRISVVTG